MLKKLCNLAVDLLFPETCGHCHQHGGLLCDECYEQIEFFATDVALKLEKCWLDRLIAATVYQDVTKSMIKTLKYQGVKSMGLVIGELLYQAVNIPDADVLIPVPLHLHRQQERGFNQAEVISKSLSELIQVPSMAVLARTRHTPRQAKIKDRGTRLTALTDCFEISHEGQKFLDEWQDKKAPRAILIDDVTTTGTTLNECAKVLKQHGFGPVVGLVMAHGW